MGQGTVPCPTPDAIVRKHRLDRSRSVMLGDSYENDYCGAISAGLHAIWLSGANTAEGFYREKA